MTVQVNPITETQTVTSEVQVGRSFTVTLSEREALLAVYLFGNVPCSWGTSRVFGELLSAGVEDPSFWDESVNLTAYNLTDHQKEVVEERLRSVSDRRE